MSKYFRTVYQVVVLSQDAPAADLSIEEIDYAITEGDCSGSVTVTSKEEVTAAEMAVLLESQGSEPGFFGITDDEIWTPYEFGYADGLASPHDLAVGRTWSEGDFFHGDQTLDPNEEYDRGVNAGQQAAGGEGEQPRIYLPKEQS